MEDPATGEAGEEAGAALKTLQIIMKLSTKSVLGETPAGLVFLSFRSITN